MRPVFVLLCLSILLGANAQDTLRAPDFQCTRSEAGGEILTWANTPVDCGPYEATELYRSDNRNGPFTLLAEFTDRDVTEYRDENPAGRQLFYYLRYRYDCPGAVTPNSDTLDSFVPLPPPLDYVSVEDGDLVLHWTMPRSPEVDGYVVLEVTPGGSVPLDTIGLVNSYRITGVPEEELTERRYRVAAIDACGNDSPQSNILNAVDLSLTGGQACVAEVTVTPDAATLTTFSDYDSLSLYVSIGGGEYAQRPTTLEGDNLIYDGAQDGQTLCFYVSILLDSQERARTRVQCLTVNISNPVRLDLYGVELVADGQLRFGLSEAADPPAELTGVLEQSGLADPVLTLTDIFDGDEELTVRPVMPPRVGDSLRIVTTDSCGRERATNWVAPVWLAAGDGAGAGNALEWTPLVNELAGGTTYTVLRNGTPIADGLTTLNYLDAEVGNDDSLTCYRILASFVPEGRPGEGYNFQSNEVCLQPEIVFYVPNAINPTAAQPENRVLRPFFRGGIAPAEYSLQIYDRWGGLMFQSDDPSRGWAGELDGRRAPAGAYVYVLSYRLSSGNFARRTGVVHLLY